jgi:hypothetical protein
MPGDEDMANLTLVELNHDYVPKPEEYASWAAAIALYMRSGDRDHLPQGVSFRGARHHADPDPLRPQAPRR